MAHRAKIKNKEYLAAFTVIEITIIVIVLSLALTILVPQFQRIRSQLNLSRATYKFAQDLRRVQNLALSGVEYKDSAGDVQPIEGYGVYINKEILGNKKYILYADRRMDVLGGTKGEYDNLDYIIDTVDLNTNESGVVIKEISNIFNLNSVSINFEPPNPTTTIMPLNQTNIDITFALSSSLSTYRTVSINKAGLIEIK